MPVQKKVATQLITPISGLLVPFAALFHVDDTDLYVFKSGSDSNKDIIDKAQNLLNSWHEVLKVTVSDLKLSNCYWTLHGFQCKSVK